ncbi:hypothetical protein [Natranaerobius thermophilus]|uniref:Replication-relaxation n=1 Tax=Natranaerobius thermophilus (strain ATCC BAA-1301 / DSM 18059 / JW/NM-WN-LF) TaxID=457570 RepID=B2A5E2_NATTJ|nr:hypothetical protein [Natranaerobius thermophilus]ACB83976.1 hypothetical protein Nther_0380 [Natranaerobius thermophilus JW/NM-WN-LF]
MSKKKLQLQDRDVKMLEDVIDFNGLPTEAIIQVHFENKRKYAYERLKQLKKSGYLKEKYYYKSENKMGKRMSAILYASSKTVKLLRPTLNPTSVQPRDDELDVHYLLGSLYNEIPNMMPARRAKKVLKLKSFDPFDVAIDGDPVIFLYVLNKKAGVDALNRVYAFAKSHGENGLNFVIANHNPSKKIFSPPLRYITWDMSLEVIPNILKDQNYYMKEFEEIMKNGYNNQLEYAGSSGAFLKYNYKNKDIYLAELITGDNYLRRELYIPPKTAFVYIKNRKQLEDVKIQSDNKFYAFSRDEKKRYKMEKQFSKTIIEEVDS